MKKKKFVALVSAVAGGLLFVVGMCMVMVWKLMISGILIGNVGILLLLFLIPVIKGLK